MKRVIALFGPTASGKSSLAFQLSLELNGLIVSADSMQIYKKMDIGTAKPSEAEMKQVPHRMINICSHNETFSVYDYKKRAEEEIDDALSAGLVPIVTGGTGLYFDALFYNTDFGEMEIKPEIRNELSRRVLNGEAAILLSELFAIDPETAAPLHEKDVKRIVRGLEVYLSTGTPLSVFKANSRTQSSKFHFLKLFLNYKKRDLLYNRINQRVDLMLDQGLVRETEGLLRDGCFESPTASQAIGYKELLPYFQNQRSLDECVSILKQKTRNYAKRQLTWFRRYEDAITIWMDEDPDPFARALNLCNKFLKEV